MARTLVILAVFAIALSAVFLREPSEAHAAFPGANGKIAFSSTRDSVAGSDIYVMDADGNNVTRVIVDAPPVGFETGESGVTWSPTGDRLAFVSDRATGGATFTMDADGGSVQGVGVPYTHDPSWSPDGTAIIASSNWFTPDLPVSWDLFVVDLGSGTYERITQTAEDEIQPSWSPDGSAIAFAAGDFECCSYVGADIYVSDADGQNRVNITNDPATDLSPDWSPDGSRIAFASNRDGNFDIYIMNADGGDVQQLTDDSGSDGDPAWSPDGTQITFTTDRDGNSEVYVKDADGGIQRNLTNDPASDYDPSWQPILVGDANCAGGISSIDAALILQAEAGLIDSLPCEQTADVNGDGATNSLDAALILQYVAGIIATLPP